MCAIAVMIMCLFSLTIPPPPCYFFFFFNDTATTEIYTLSLHDALPIFHPRDHGSLCSCALRPGPSFWGYRKRSEEHTSELQSRLHLVCRLLLEKKKKRREYECASLSISSILKCMHRGRYSQCARRTHLV